MKDRKDHLNQLVWSLLYSIFFVASPELCPLVFLITEADESNSITPPTEEYFTVH